MFEPIINRKIRVALLGCGRIAGKHFDAIANLKEDLELCGICDDDPARMAALAIEAPQFTCLKEMLTAASPDLLIICTPSGMHAKQTIEAAAHGVNVITEKPMATSWEDGKAMVQACDDAGVKLFVVKQNRKNATMQMLKKAVDAGRFGKIYSIHVNVFWTRPQAYYDQDEWRGTWSMDGGALMNQASHYIDLLAWLNGPIESVHAMIATLERDIEAEDTAVMNLRWQNGALGSAAVTMLTYPKNLEGSITVLGSHGTARIGGVAVNEIQQWQFADSQPEDSQIAESSYQTTSVYGFGHPYYYQNVIAAMRGESVAEVDGHEGLKSLALLIAAYRSAQQQAQISLPLA